MDPYRARRGENVQQPRPSLNYARRQGPDDEQMASSSSSSVKPSEVKFSFEDGQQYVDRIRGEKQWHYDQYLQRSIAHAIVNLIKDEYIYLPFNDKLVITDSVLRDSGLLKCSPSAYPIIRYRPAFIDVWCLNNKWKYEWRDNSLIIYLQSKKEDSGNVTTKKRKREDDDDSGSDSEKKNPDNERAERGSESKKRKHLTVSEEEEDEEDGDSDIDR